MVGDGVLGRNTLVPQCDRLPPPVATTPLVRVTGGQVLAVRDQHGGGVATHVAEDCGAVVYAWDFLATPAAFTTVDTLLALKLARTLKPNAKNPVCACAPPRLTPSTLRLALG